MYPGTQRLVSRPAAVITAVVLVMLGIGTGAYAYESPEVVEGHPLHFLKANIENIEGRIKFSPEDKAQWHLKMQDRRMAEAEYFTQKNDFRKPLFEQGMNQMDQGLQVMAQIEVKEQRQAMLKNLSEMEQARIRMLQDIKPQLSEYSQEMIDRLIAEHTRRMQEQIKLLEVDEQIEFQPQRTRRFRIIMPPPGSGYIEISSSSEAILTADLLPEEFGNAQVIYIQQ